MKILTKKTLFTNLFLFSLIAIVFAVSFVPDRIMPISVNGAYSAIYHGNREKKQISIMVNVYENAEIVKKMVNVFNEYNAKCTFFVGGCWADDNEETLKFIVDNGHELGNHGYFHKDHKKLSYEQNLQEISLTDKIVSSLANVKINLFAPPSGSYSNNTLKAASSLNYATIMWSKDTIDWRDKDLDKIVSRATKNVTCGDLVLMHPKEHTLIALPKILKYYNGIGFSVVTVTQNISE